MAKPKEVEAPKPEPKPEPEPENQGYVGVKVDDKPNSDYAAPRASKR